MNPTGLPEPSAEIVILSAVRTPLGNFQGALASVPAPRLGATAIRAAVARAGVEASDVHDVIMGNVLQAGEGQAPARQAALYAGLLPATRAVTVNKVCGSGLQSIIYGARALAAGDASIVAAGGMENMSVAPFLLPKAREGYRLGHQQVIDSVISEGLWDPYNDLHMGACAEQCATRYSFSRVEQDAYAIASFQRANAAQKSGLFADEIAPVEAAGPKGSHVVEHDDGPARVNYDRIPTLKPVFEKGGTITAANASTLNDGAAAVVITTRRTSDSKGLTPIARIVSFGGHAQEPLWFTTAPVQAARYALAGAGWSQQDVDLWEVNEAFAVVPLAFMRELNLSHDIVNVRGGAISLGHPIGCSGTRIVVTLIAALTERKLKRGVAAICIGGGEGLAVCIEML